jgi:hypothetical protein
MSNSRLVWIAVRTVVIGLATYAAYGQSIVTAEACARCANVGGSYMCISTSPPSTFCEPAGNGCLDYGSCNC